MQAASIKKNFTIRYLIALSLIAILATSAFYILYFAIKSSETTALVVNMAGKQRMLSQRIASLSQQFYHEKYGTKEGLGADSLQKELKKIISEMRHANQSLSTGNLLSDKHTALSSQMEAIYFGKMQLRDRVNNYLVLAERIIHAKTPVDADRLIANLLHSSDELLPDLNSAVLQYQIEGENKIQRILAFATIDLIFILISLLFEIKLIFRPMSEKIYELFNEVQEHQLYLEQQILQRTMNLEKSNRKLQHLASHDPLTGLKNRLNLEKNLETFITHYRQKRIPYAVVMFDIDWFKTINDSYGHEAGDFILCEVAAILLNHTRDEDSVHRSGGEEFVLLLTKITFDQAVDKANAIRLSVEHHPFLYNDILIHVTLSGGVYHPSVTDSSKIQEIMKLTDAALYEAKHHGRNQIVPVVPAVG